LPNMGLALTQPPLKAGVDATAVSAWTCEGFFGAASRQSIRVRTPRLASDAPVIVGHAVFEDRCADLGRAARVCRPMSPR
jgi:hypothetical protein